MAQLHIVSSSHSYHNCKIPFLYEHIMTSFHDTPAPTPTYSYYPSHHAHLPRISSSAPIKFAPHSHSVSIKVVSCPCHRRSSAILLLFATPSTNQKFYIVKLLYSRQWALFACTLYIMYHQTVVFVLVVPIPPTLPSDFSYYSLRRPGPLFLFFPRRT